MAAVEFYPKNGKYSRSCWKKSDKRAGGTLSGKSFYFYGLCGILLRGSIYRKNLQCGVAGSGRTGESAAKRENPRSETGNVNAGKRGIKGGTDCAERRAAADICAEAA